MKNVLLTIVMVVFVTVLTAEIYTLDGKLGVGVEVPEKSLVVADEINVVGTSGPSTAHLLGLFPTKIEFNIPNHLTLGFYREFDEILFKKGSEIYMKFSEEGIKLDNPNGSKITLSGPVTGGGGISTQIGPGGLSFQRGQQSPLGITAITDVNFSTPHLNASAFKTTQLRAEEIGVGYTFGINEELPEGYALAVKGKMLAQANDDSINDKVELSHIGLTFKKNENTLMLLANVNYSYIVSTGGFTAENIKTPKLGVGFSPAEDLPEGYNFAVKGKIVAQELKILANDNAIWPDYVFKQDYKLQELHEVEKFITENSHLPGIPSAEEVAQDGINIAEMQAKLLQKIEELTLHMIKLNNENQQLKKEISKLKK
jgi:hypothetical protein